MDLHRGILVRQTTACTMPSALKSGVALLRFWTSQSKALKVRAKLKTFLKMMVQVNPSIARSPIDGYLNAKAREKKKGYVR